MTEGLSLTNHDPIDRQLDGEPHFALMGRDALAPHFVRLYAAVVGGQYERAAGLLTRILDVAKSRAQRPHKDTDHAWSARRVADQMDEWFLHNMTGEKPVNRVNTAPDRDQDAFRPRPTIAEIKAARPPAEPEEAS